jgi:Zn-dependent peptidase ImmA (M78 family)/transcriptional regulator with XRE-family HTH domain
MAVGRILKQVREQRHFNLEAVASAANISPRSLLAFESGEASPSYLQLEKLALTYGLPTYVLAHDALPNIPESILDFRRRDPVPAKPSPRGARKIWNAEELSTFVNQIAIPLQFQTPRWVDELPRGPVSIALATGLRRYFEGWAASRIKSLDITGTPEQIFLGAFRLFVEAQGTIVNINDAPPEDYLGFFIRPDAARPLIFINRSISSRKAQLFTAVHEYAHFLAGATGISNPFVTRNTLERTCNQFAAEFLAPLDLFRKIAEQAKTEVGNNLFSLVRTVSGRSFLSGHATAIRLVEAGYISQDQLAVWESQIKPRAEKDEEKEQEANPQPAPQAKRISELGYLSVYLADKAIKAKIIDAIDAKNGLGLSEKLQERAFSLARRRFEAATQDVAVQA